MIDGRRVALRPVEETDYPDIQRWTNDARNAWWNDAEHPSSLEDVKDAESKARLGGHPFIIETEGRAIGRIELREPTISARGAVLVVPTGEPDLWTGELGADAIDALCAYGFANLDLHLVEASCLDGDDSAIGALESCGFITEASLRDRSWKDGRWFARRVLSITRDEFEAQGSRS